MGGLWWFTNIYKINESWFNRRVRASHVNCPFEKRDCLISNVGGADVIVCMHECRSKGGGHTCDCFHRQGSLLNESSLFYCTHGVSASTQHLSRETLISTGSIGLADTAFGIGVDILAFCVLYVDRVRSICIIYVLANFSGSR